MAKTQNTLTPWRLLAVAVICLAMSPLWMLSTPVLWFELSGDSALKTIPPFAAGSLLVGVVFVLVAKLRRKAPSYAFSLILPAIGLVGYAVAEALRVPFYFSLYDVFSYAYVGGLWAYLGGCYFTFPLALLHTWLLRLALGAKTRIDSPDLWKP